MVSAPLTANEDARIALLRALRLLDTPAEEVFDRITRLAARTFHVPMAFVSLIDSDRQFFKSHFGLDCSETPRQVAFCAHAIHRTEPLVVPDAHLDLRFADNPLVTGAPFVRFYAGMPVFSSEGIALGTLCVIDHTPREFSQADIDTLKDLAAMVQREIMQREATLASTEVFQHSSRSMAESEARFQATFQQAAVGIALVGIDGSWQRVNSKLCSIIGYSEQELLQLTFQDITYAEDLDTDLSLVQQLLDGKIQQYSMEKRYLCKSGELVWINLSVSLVRGADGKPQHFISVLQDIQGRKEAEHALRRLRRELEDRVRDRTAQLQQTNEVLSRAIEQQQRSEQALAAREGQLRAVLENAPDAYVAIDENGLITQWNRQAELTFGWSSEEAIGRPLDETIIPAEFREAHRRGMKHYMATGEGLVLNQRLELTALRRSGELFPVEIRISPLPTESGQAFCAFLHDITARKQMELSLQQAATHDALTGLPNRRALLERMSAGAARADRARSRLGVLFLDLDGFKAINDHHGHEGGDHVLKQFALRLQSCVRETDTVARLAGDEFVILLEGLQNGIADAEKVGDKILRSLHDPLLLNGEAIPIRTSIGIYVREVGHLISAEGMLAAADQAMYQAKRGGKNKIYLAKVG